MNFRLLTGLVLLLAAAPLHAGGGANDARPDVGALLTQWRQQNGAEWRAEIDGETGYAQLLWGGRTRSSFRPSQDAQFVDLARQTLDQSFALHGIDAGTLEPVRALHIPLGQAGSTDKMTVRFRQVVNGVPVENGYVNVLFDMNGRTLSVQSTGLPRLTGFATSPSLTGERALQRAFDAYRLELGVEANVVGTPELVIDQFFDGEQRVARLAWRVDLQYMFEDAEPQGFTWWVDALNGAAYRKEPNVHSFDVSGTVTSNASPGLLPDIASNPPSQQPMRFMRVTSGTHTTFTDTTGNFTLTGVTAPAPVTVTYVGTYQNVTINGAAATSLTTTLNNATGNTIAMDSPASAGVTAQANCMRVIPLMRDFILATNPSDTLGNFSTRANTAVSGTCNAYYDGSSINFFNAGGGCSNTAYSTVISHEHGHWMNDRYGTGNGGDGMGEGNADVWSMYIHDTPIIGANFSGGSFIRTGNNSRAFCGDANPGCYGEVHNDGEPWMGAAWKVRNNLKTALGAGPGSIVANTIFLGWMEAYNQSQIRSVIETQWLTLDDDDGNINSGTPHYTQINNGFLGNSWPGVQLFPISITNVTALPNTQNETGPYNVSANVIANQHPPLTAVNLLYRVNGGAFTSVPMAGIGGNNFQGSIPGLVSPVFVEYYVSATDSNATTNTFPATAPVLVDDFHVGILHVLRSDSFDASDGGYTHGSYGDTSNAEDDWQRGIPKGKTGTGWADPGAAFSAPYCWANDLGSGSGTLANGAYSANVHSYLRTPSIDCTGAVGTTLRFKRWLSVQTSASDQARLLVNGNQVYTNPAANMNDGGWTAQTIDISAFADNNPSVQIEWQIRSNGSVQYGGWNIDDVKVEWNEHVPAPCPSPTSYCTSLPNSTGTAALMSWTGLPNVSVNNLQLSCSGCPGNSVGLFFYGSQQTQVAFGNGYRCVTGQVFRTPVVQTDFIGDAFQPIDVNTLPHPIHQGEVWNFQFWYRNAAAGGAGFNLSDGLSVTFCP